MAKRLILAGLVLSLLSACGHGEPAPKPSPRPSPTPSPSPVTRAAMVVLCRDLRTLQGAVDDAVHGRASTAETLSRLGAVGTQLAGDAAALERSGQPEAATLVRDLARATTEITGAINKGQNEFLVITSNLGRITTDLQRVAPGRCSSIASP